VREGSYVYNVVEYQKFSVKQYKEWIGALDAPMRG
jgi:hypothetical protein